MSVEQSEQSGKPVSQWSDDEIQTALASIGGAQVPVTSTTRPILERRLEKLLLKTRDSVKNDAGSSEETREKRGGEGGTVGLSEERHASSSTIPTKDGESQVVGFEGYYGVVVANAEALGGLPLSPFYTTKSEALRAVKSIPGARFKKFSSQASAEAFSNSPGSGGRRDEGTPSSAGKRTTTAAAAAAAGESAEKTSDVQISDKPNQFPSLKTPDLSKFRGLVESGDVAAFSQTVWNNPRYLLNCYGDAPEILQAGSRYNALHCAVRAGKLEICKELVSILQSPQFWALAYPTDCEDTVQRRRAHILDLYLNMQDRVIGETPLHYACKLGHADIVAFLLSLPSLDISLTNKFGKTAAEIVCANAKSSSRVLKDKITELMNAPPIYYVPVLRAADNCTPPQLTPPCTMAQYHQHQGTLTDDRGTPVIGQAFAGPMSPAKADDFYCEWRSPSHSGDWRETVQIKRTDATRGLERVGRKLAEQHEVGWQEYWGFLGCYCDLRRLDGLDRLECYLTSLATPHKPHRESAVTGRNLSEDNIKMTENADISRELFPNDREGKKQQRDGEEGGSEGKTQQRDGEEGESEGKTQQRDGEVGGSEIDSEEPLRDFAMGLSAVGEEVASVSKEEEEEEGGREGVGENDLDSLKEAMAQLVVREREGEGEGEGEGVRRGENGKNRGEYQDTDDRVATTVSTQHSAKKIHDRENGCPVWSEQTSPRSNPATEPSTLYACISMGAEAGPSVRGSGDDGAVGGGGEVTECDSATCQPETPSVGGGGVNLFLLGREPTKVDRDVYLAVAGAPDLTGSLYPHTVHWMDRVKSYSEHVRKSWRTPQSSWQSDSRGGRGGTPARSLVSPLLMNSPPHSPLPLPPTPLSSGALSPFSPLHTSLNATSTPSRVHYATPRPRPRPRQVLRPRNTST